MNNLEEVKKVQKLAYEAAVFTRHKLEIGMTEKEAADIMEQFFIQKGHHLFFHRPFAWFGDRTGFKGFKRPSLPSKVNALPHLGKEFLPSSKKLQLGMPVILDVAPSVEGLAVDIGYSFSFGDHPELLKARHDLLTFRKLILECANQKLSVKDLYLKVESKIKELGYENCHGLYPLGVLGHKVGRLPLLKIPKLSIMGFHPQAYLYLLKEMISGVTILTENETRPMGPGLWAIEPHLGKNDFGVKFEEILVIDENGAYWLDDSLPHVTEMI